MFLALLAAAAVAASARIDAWCVDSLQSVFRDATPPMSAASPLDMRGARGQEVSGQIVLRASQQAERVTGVTCSALAAGGKRIDQPDFRWAFVGYFHLTKNSTATPPEELLVKAPADVPDDLSEDREMALDPGRTQPIWVGLRIPENAEPGVYDGSIAVQTSAGEISRPVRLTVYGFTFPQHTRLNVSIWMDTAALSKYEKAPQFTEPFWQVLQRTAGLMHAHHQNTIIVAWNTIHLSRGADNALQYDYTVFDRWVETFLKAGFDRIEITHVGARENGKWDDKVFKAYDLGYKNPATGATENVPMEQWLADLESHLRSKGWLERTMLHIGDEPIEVNTDSWRKLSQRAHAAAPHLRRIDAIQTPDLRGDLEVWVPQLNCLAQWLSGYQAAQREGAELWFYTAWLPQDHFPNRLLDYALIKTRMLHWFNYMTGTTGYLHWGYNFWDVPSYQFAPGDNAIVYPGKEGPRSSLRYEAMREGIEDYEYLCLLEDGARAAAERLKETGFDARAWTSRYLHKTARDFADYTRKPEELLATRDALGRAIAVLRGPCATIATAHNKGDVVIVDGRTEPDTELKCGDETARSDADGRFSLRVSTRADWVTLEIKRGDNTASLPLPAE